MRIRLTLALLATAFSGALIAPTAASAATAPNEIIGGSVGSSAPWAAAVFRNGSFTCSGSVIAAQYVLTARHCTGSGMSVRVGSVNRTSGGVVVSVASFSSQFDLAVLRLASPVNTSRVTLASSNPPVGATNSIYGWGMTCYSGCSASTQLKTASVRVSTLSARDAYGGQAIGSTRINGNAWRGDSGGPQFYNGQQVGVASTADGTSRQFYGSVPNSRSWIRSVAGV
jgi:secreted trypsin-like serine protease